MTCLLFAMPMAVGAKPTAPESVAPPAVSSDTVDVVEMGDPQEATRYEPPQLTDKETLLAYSLLGFGLCVLMIQFIQLSRQAGKIRPNDIMLVYSVTLIIVGTMFLIVTGITGSQLAPALGLFGTMIGYLLGRNEKPGSRENKDRDVD